MPTTEIIMNYGGMSAPSDIATLLLERNVDVGSGYVIEVKKLRTVGGVRETVTAAIASTVSQNATSFTVDEVYGFEPGDVCIIEEGSTFDVFKLSSALGTTLTTFTEMGVSNVYTTAAVVAVKSLWIVDMELIPQMVGPYHRLTVRSVPGYWKT